MLLEESVCYDQCVLLGFCHETTQISYNYVCVCMYTCIPSFFNLLCTLPPTTICGHRTPGWLPALNSFLLAVCFTHGAEYMSVLLCQLIPPSFPCRVHKPFSMSASPFEKACSYTWRRQWHPTPVFLPGRIPRMGESGGLPPMGLHSRT